MDSSHPDSKDRTISSKAPIISSLEDMVGKGTEIKGNTISNRGSNTDQELQEASRDLRAVKGNTMEGATKTASREDHRTLHTIT